MSKDVNGCVYVIRHKRLGLVKIGFTKQPQKRMDDLLSGSECELVGFMVGPDAVSGEKELHGVYEHRRLPGSEWFELEVDESVMPCGVELVGEPFGIDHFDLLSMMLECKAAFSKWGADGV